MQQRRRHALYLSELMSERLELMAQTQQLAKSEILERALAQLLAPEASSSVGSMCAVRQDRMARAIDRLERDLAMTTELVVYLLRYTLFVTPPLPEPEREAARALSRKHFDLVVGEVARVLRSDQRFAKRVIKLMTKVEQPAGAQSSRPAPSSAPPPANSSTANTPPQPRPTIVTTGSSDG